MSVEHQAVVVGGGIAGLAAAVSLARVGWKVTVLERAGAFTEVGAGLTITPNGMSALACLGIDDAVRDAGFRVRMAGTTDELGSWLLRVPPASPSNSSQDVYGIHRQDLHGVLLAAAQGVVLMSGTRVISVTPGVPSGARARVDCVSANGALSYDADLVIGADGLHSTVRGLVAPGTAPRFSGKSSWRGIVSDAALVAEDLLFDGARERSSGRFGSDLPRCTGTGTPPRRKAIVGPMKRPPPCIISRDGQTPYDL